jgi:hypothetical protein
VVILDDYGCNICHAVCVTVMGRTVTLKWVSGELKGTCDIAISSGVVLVSCSDPNVIIILDIESGTWTSDHSRHGPVTTLDMDQTTLDMDQ